jgi:hypothetical protein
MRPHAHYESLPRLGPLSRLVRKTVETACDVILLVQIGRRTLVEIEGLLACAIVTYSLECVDLSHACRAAIEAHLVGGRGSVRRGRGSLSCGIPEGVLPHPAINTAAAARTPILITVFMSSRRFHFHCHFLCAQSGASMVENDDHAKKTMVMNTSSATTTCANRNVMSAVCLKIIKIHLAVACRSVMHDSRSAVVQSLCSLSLSPETSAPSRCRDSDG